MLNFSLSSLFQRHFCHSGNNSGHTHVVRVPSAGIELAGQASERLGKCLLLVWLRLQASVWDPSTLGCPPFMDTFGHNAPRWNGPWIHGGRRHNQFWHLNNLGTRGSIPFYQNFEDKKLCKKGLIIKIYQNAYVTKLTQHLKILRPFRFELEEKTF